MAKVSHYQSDWDAGDSRVTVKAHKRSPRAKSGIHIKASHKGLFTAKANAAGKSVQQEAAAVLAPGSKASPATRKQAAFAKAAAKWKHG